MDDNPMIKIGNSFHVASIAPFLGCASSYYMDAPGWLTIMMGTMFTVFNAAALRIRHQEQQYMREEEETRRMAMAEADPQPMIEIDPRQKKLYEQRHPKKFDSVVLEFPIERCRHPAEDRAAYELRMKNYDPDEDCSPCA
jgi:hypothetical protein